jgi:hypothetical protein
MKTLITGIDTLDMGYCIDQYICYPEMFAEIEEAKQKASEKEIDGGYTLYGRDFMVKPFGAGRYDYILINDNIKLTICKYPTGGQKYPEVRVAYGSPFLWNGYWYENVKEFEKWLNEWAQVVDSKASRCDLTTDINAELPIFDNNYTGLITRAKKKTDFRIDKHHSGRKNTGYSIGKGSLMCRIYPKDYEAKISQKEYFYTLWEANGWDGKSPVTRFEFQCRRKYLKEWSVNSIEDINNQAPDLWKYNTEKWISIRQPGKDVEHHANRWPKTELWDTVIDSGKNFGDLSGVTRLTPGIPKYEHLMRMIKGCASQAEAVSGKSLKEEILKIMNSSGYNEEVKKKEYRLGRYH